MNTGIITTQKLTVKKTILLFVLGFFAGGGLYHFGKAVSNLF